MGDQDVLKDMFEASQRNSSSKVVFTEEETKRFKKAFDDPEFRKMFAEYMDEIQDPKYREETESYIDQLEKEEKVPQGKELVRPTAGFVVKTRKISESEENTDIEIGDKVFINIVQSNKIAKPVQTKGSNWSVPYSLGPPHMEKDKNASNVTCFDCCFHPEALELATKFKQIKNLLVQTAMNGVVTAFKRQNQDVKLSEDYHVLKGVQYKSGQIPAMMIDASAKNKEWNKSKGANQVDTTAKNVPTESTESALNKVDTTATAPDDKKAAINPSKAPYFKKGFLSASKGHMKSNIEEIKQSKIDVASESVANAKHLKYAITERGGEKLASVGLDDANALSRSNIVHSRRPESLVVRFEVEKVKKASLIQLDVAERQVKLTYEDIYDMDISLPYPVYDKKGTAKYDKTLKTLTLTLPVIPLPTMSIERQSTNQESTVEEVSEREMTLSQETIHHQEERVTPSKPPHHEKHTRWLRSLDESEAQGSKQLSEEIQAKVSSVMAIARQSQNLSSSEPTAAVHDTSESLLNNQSEFVASKKFLGKRQGYLFSTRNGQTGYYVDVQRSVCPQGDIITTTDNVTVTSDYILCPYEYRQTREHLPILIQVSDIMEESVHIKYFDTSFQVLFHQRDVSQSIGMKKYGINIDFHHPIDPSKCRYNVAIKNMVVVLYKANPGIWYDTNEAVFEGDENDWNGHNLENDLIRMDGKGLQVRSLTTQEIIQLQDHCGIMSSASETNQSSSDEPNSGRVAKASTHTSDDNIVYKQENYRKIREDMMLEVSDELMELD